MRVLAVSSWQTPCGIADYAEAVQTYAQAADSGLTILPSAAALDPAVGMPYALGETQREGPFDLVWLNHHDALHARWTPDHVQVLKARGIPTVVTYHDTRSGAPGAPNGDKLWEFARQAAAVIVHEPVSDVPAAICWRQGIPAPAQRPAVYDDHGCWWDGKGWGHQGSWKAFPQQPVLGTVGFNFPWKNYDRLAQLTGEEGWALVILSNDATEADEARWRAMNPSLLVVREFLPQPIAINYLAGCDATVFMYECQNNGTSGAIRQGIAARKTVLAHGGCRQFRDLRDGELLGAAVCWIDDWDTLRWTLQHRPIETLDPSIHALATRDSWTVRGQDYAQLFRRVVAEARP